MADPDTFIVALIPDDTTVRRAVRVNRQFRLLGESELVLNTDGPSQPHVSIIHVVLDPDRIEQTTSLILQRLLSQPIPLTFKPALVEASGGYVFWDIQPEAALMDQAFRIVEAVAQARTADVEITWSMSDLQRSMHAAYGYPNVGAAFRPHITVAKGAPGFLPEALTPWPTGTSFPLTVPARRLVLGRCGEHGALVHIERVLHEF